MSEQEDMAVPVTRGELRQEIAKLHRKIDLWGGAVADRFTRLEKRMDALEKRMDAFEKRMNERFDAFEKRMHADLARLAKAIAESVAQSISVIDEKYKDLPARVARLERQAAGSKRPRRR